MRGPTPPTELQHRTYLKWIIVAFMRFVGPTGYLQLPTGTRLAWLKNPQAEALFSASMISGIARDMTFEGTMITDPGSAGFKIQ